MDSPERKYRTLFDLSKELLFREHQEMLDFFDQQDEIDVYFALAGGIADAYAKNRELTADKVEQLSRAYRQILFTLGFALAAAWLYMIWTWAR